MSRVPGTKPIVLGQLGQDAIETAGLLPAAYLLGIRYLNLFAAQGGASADKVSCDLVIPDGYFKAGDKPKAIEFGGKAHAEAKRRGASSDELGRIQKKLDTYGTN